MKFKIKKEDIVEVIAGKFKGKRGKVLKTLRQQYRLIIEKVNVVKKHIKKTSQRKGERIEIEAPIHYSNVQVICPSCNKKTRVGREVSKSGKRIRICKKCGASLEKPFVKS